jgi:hypothetical protein
MSVDEKQDFAPFVVAGVAFIFVAVVVFALYPRSTSASDVPQLTFVSGTEYTISEAGQSIVEARFKNGTSAFDYTGGVCVVFDENTTCPLVPPCTMRLWYPNKTLFLSQDTVTSASETEYIAFTTPNVTGIYEYQADCLLLGGRRGVISKAFHVSAFQNDTTERLKSGLNVTTNDSRPRVWVTQ